MEPWHAMSWYGMLLGPVTMVVLLVTVVLTAVLLLRWLGEPDHRMASHVRPAETSLDTVEERFARGEVDKREVEEQRGVLGG